MGQSKGQKKSRKAAPKLSEKGLGRNREGGYRGENFGGEKRRLEANPSRKVTKTKTRDAKEKTKRGNWGDLV